MRAIISDIHGNLEALEAVLAEIDARDDVDEIFCLGDIVGYGPDPCGCLDAVRERCDFTLLGNHDQAVLFDPEGFNATAERAVFWHRRQIETSRGGNDRMDFLGALPRRRIESPGGKTPDGGPVEFERLFVHGSARNPLNEYVFPEDVYNQAKMDKIFTLVPRHCFQGHTHIPGVFTEALDFVAPPDVDGVYELKEGSKALVNVGSVGQPRDGDPRASYVLLDGRTVNFNRVEYDIEKTAAKIYDIPDLDNFLGDRLSQGR